VLCLSLALWYHRTEEHSTDVIWDSDEKKEMEGLSASPLAVYIHRSFSWFGAYPSIARPLIMARTKTASPSTMPAGIPPLEPNDTRTPTPPPILEPPRPIIPSVNWIENNGVHYPFPALSKSKDGVGERVDAIQFRSVGVVTASFLSAGALSHTIKFKISDEDVAKVKKLVESGPISSDMGDFYWPVSNGVAVANNKDDLASPFAEVYDGRSKGLDDLDDEDMIPMHRIHPGVKVCVEYTPTVWSMKKIRDGPDATKFSRGSSLKLQAIVLLEDGLNFGSPRKRRKLAG
jgi:hypothetical protein